MSKADMPEHVAIIMDGNGRWAKKRFLPRSFGHKAGVSALKALIQCCPSRGIQILTIYAFSTENWSRPDEEVSFLMRLFLESLKAELAALHHSGVSLRFMGELSDLNPGLLEIISEAQLLTCHNTGLILNVALNYGARAEILKAMHQVCQEVSENKRDLSTLSSENFSAYLYTQGLRDPDLLIRTSGECRISNFLLWQCAYTELYFVDTLFPDFNVSEFDRALAWYKGRERRYGKISEQMDP